MSWKRSDAAVREIGLCLCSATCGRCCFFIPKLSSRWAPTICCQLYFCKAREHVYCCTSQVGFVLCDPHGQIFQVPREYRLGVTISPLSSIHMHMLGSSVSSVDMEMDPVIFQEVVFPQSTRKLCQSIFEKFSVSLLSYKQTLTTQSIFFHLNTPRKTGLDVQGCRGCFSTDFFHGDTSLPFPVPQ